MSQFRKKPIVIEALRWTGANTVGLLDWIGQSARQEGSTLIIQTLEGDHEASAGDWIICGVKGEFYPCKPDIFAETYEAVPSDSLMPDMTPAGLRAAMGATDHYVEQAEALALATMRAKTVVPDELREEKHKVVYCPQECGSACEESDCPYTHHESWYVDTEHFHTEEEAKQALTFLATPRPDARQDAGGWPVPDGWKLVPVEPTPRMIDAGHRIPGITYDQAATAYAEMLDAAPPAPEAGR